MAARRTMRLATSTPTPRKLGAFVLAIAVAAGCSASAAGPDSTTVGTVGNVGQLPGSFSVATPESSPDTIASTATTVVLASTTSVVEPTEFPEPIGAQVTGNRLLIIGDSLTASIAQRYGGEACASLVPLGWEVEVDAETGRFIDFGARVLDKRLDAGWDAAVVFLGNNYGYDRGVYQLALHSLLLRLHPRPVALITTALFRPEQKEVNDTIREEADLFENVSVIDWEAVSEDPSLTGVDGIHLTDAGRDRLGFEIAYAMGTAPKQPGKCLSTNYRDDSAGSANGPAGNSTTPKPKPKPTTTATTVKTTVTTIGSSTSPTATTVKPSTGSTSPTGTTLPATSPTTAASTPTTAAPPTTPAPVTTLAPVTSQPPVTVPPVTVPPTTAPPTTAPPPPPPSTVSPNP